MSEDNGPTEETATDGPPTHETDGGVDYQVGAHDVDDTTVPLSGEGSADDFVEFELEAKTVFKRLADDIYQSAETGIREPLTNGVTAVLKAIKNGDLRADEGVLEITVDESNGQTTLTIRDNGVGIPEQELRQVVAVVGRSTTRDDGNLAGQFGMGFLAMFKLVGTNGGFVMHTNPRENGSESYSGVWKSGGFTIDKDSSLSGGLGNGEYGTQFELHLKESISTGDVREWVAENAKFARVPVIYNEYDENGNTVYTEDYGGTGFDDQYSNDPETFVLSIDTPYFTARCSNNPLGETILLDVPIERECRRVTKAPWPDGVDIRLKNENGVVVDGPHEGLMPVAESEYDSMSAERQSKFVSENQLTDSDVVMPGPIGTRESLETNRGFWKWLGEQFTEKYNQRARSLLAGVDSPADIWSLSESDYTFLRDAHPFSAGERTEPSEIRTAYATEYTVDLADDVVMALAALTRTVDRAPRSEYRTYSKKANLNSGVDVGDLTYEAKGGGRDGTVYMGVTLNDDKATVVHSDNDHNVVVGVGSTDDYEFYTTALGWEKLKDVTKSRVRAGEFDVGEMVKDTFLGELPETTQSQLDGSNTSTGTSSDDALSEQLIIHRGTKRDEKDKTSVQKLRRACQEAAEKGYEDVRISFESINHLVAFPESSDRCVSDYYHLTDNGISVFKCRDDTWDSLADTPFITHIDDHVEAARSVQFETTEGTHTLSSAPDNLVFHLVPSVQPNVTDEFTNREFAQRVERVLVEEPWDLYMLGWESLDDITYAPITHAQLSELLAGLESNQIILYDGPEIPHGKKQKCPKIGTLYVHAHLLDVDNALAQSVEGRFASGVTADSQRGREAREHIRFYRRAAESGVQMPGVSDT